MKAESNKVNIEYIKKLHKAVTTKYYSSFKTCIDLYRFTFYSRVNWVNGYNCYSCEIDNDFNEEYLSVCENGTFKEKYHWNRMALCARISRRKVLCKDWYRDTKFRSLVRLLSNKIKFTKEEVRFFMVSRFYMLKIHSYVRCLMLYLKWRGYTVERSFSDRSESQYLHLMPNALHTNYIKIRVSYHKQTVNDNSDLFLTLKNN